MPGVEFRPEFFVQKLCPAGGEEQQLRLVHQPFGLLFHENLADFLAQRGSAGFTSGEDGVAQSFQAGGQAGDLGGFAGLVQALESDE